MSCRRWAGRADEPCPHCGASPAEKTGSVRPADPVTAADELLFVDDDEPVTGTVVVPPASPFPAPQYANRLDDTQRTPTRAEFERWYGELDRSPVFASESAPAAPDTAPSAEPAVLPVVEPIAASAPPVLDPLEATCSAAPHGAPSARGDDEPLDPADDGRRIEIGATFGVPSARGDDEPLVDLLVTLDASGPPLLSPSEGPVAHVILALDLSASMNRTDKYPLLTQAIEGMLHDLKRPGSPEVLLSLVLYAYGAETVFRDVPASQLDPREVLRQIDRSKLRFGRYTDMVGALKRSLLIAYDQSRAHKAMPVRVCVLTDGRPQDVEGTRRVMAKLRKLPVDVDGLAFGQDADVRILQEIVSGGRGGTVKHVRADTIGEAFGRIAETAASVIANRAILDVELRPGVVGGAAYRYRPARHRFSDDAFTGGRTFTTDLGTVEAGRRYSLLFTLRLPATEASETEVGRISVRIPGYGGARMFESLVAIPRHVGERDVAPDREVQAAHDVLAALGASDPAEQLRALRTRRATYEAERRDPVMIHAIDRAIEELEARGTLEGLSKTEQAAVLAHTCSVGRLR